jgi:lipopolysaccharide heptosyltransferase II
MSASPFEAGAAVRRDFSPNRPPWPRIWVRMPNWLGDVVMAAPLVRALRASRPGAEVTLVAKPAFVPLLAGLGLAKKIITLPPRRGTGWNYWRFFRGLRRERPDAHVLFTNSLRGDLEAWCAGAPCRLGVVRAGKWRPLLTRGWRTPGDVVEAETHQTHFWARWWSDAGLLPATTHAAPDLTPFRLSATASDSTAEPSAVGLICGSENDPQKRWPVARWRALIRQLLERHPVRFRLFGTAGDSAVTREVARGMPVGAVENLAGKTDLPQLARALAECCCVAGNDTGGLHLANMLGVPVVGIFGPTNPARTGPVFAAPTVILHPRNTSVRLSRGPVFATSVVSPQPDADPPAGGAPVDAVSPERAAEACETFLATVAQAHFSP